MFSWRRPANLGAKNGRLAPPRRTPNCVSSQADPADAEHHVSPLSFSGNFMDLKEIVAGMPGATVIEAKDGYLYAEFRSRLLRFVDDFELLSDPQAGLVHVRSASRLGRRDFGVNRARVERLRRLIEARR